MSQTTLTTHPFPAISITSPTPPRPLTHHTTDTLGTPSSSSTQPPSYRLLYRGALSLPDSHLLLDGLTFAAKLDDTPSKHHTFNLLQNPLALALESMRGRPTLRFMGVVHLRDVYVDESGGVELDIHPHATLTRIYLENTFCLNPFPPPSSSSKSTKSEIGIKVALGDSNGPETTQIVIYASLQPQILLKPNTNQRPLQLIVGRLTPHPPVQHHLRLPRPDDPIPRKPPITFGRDLKKTGSLALVGTSSSSSSSTSRELKRVASGSVVGGAAPKRQKLTRVGSVADLGSGVRLGGGGASETGVGQLFKIPELPVKHAAKPKGKEKEKEKADVFGDVEEVMRVGVVESKSKGKKKVEDIEDAAGVSERANKNLIKKATIAYLARTKDPTRDDALIDKQHREFKEFYGFVYRGVGYALRTKMKLGTVVDCELVDRLVGTHVRMYLDGCGGFLDHVP